MSSHSAPPRTPPATRPLVSTASVLGSGPSSPLRSKSTFVRLANPSLVIEEDDADDGGSESEEEESPIKNKSASNWLTRRKRSSVSQDLSSVSVPAALGPVSEGIAVSSLAPTPKQSATPRSVLLEDSPPSVRSASSSFSYRYVPPHLRNQRQDLVSVKANPYLPSLGKHSLASFDRSSAPEPEDSFYTFSNEPSFAFSHFSTSPSTPGSSRDLSRSFRLSPKRIISPYPSPRSVPRPLRLSTPSFERPRATIVEEAEEEEEEEEETQADNHFGIDIEFDGESLGPVLPLASIRDEGSKVDLEQLETVSVGSSIEECGGCGLSPDRSFVIFHPCGHSCCPDCLNSIINAAAHKPPRPCDCFSCSALVESFDSCCSNFYASRGGPGIAQVLSATLQTEDHKVRTAARRSPGVASARFVTEDDLENDRMRKISRSGRRRSSVVAAAITATLLSHSKSIGSRSQPSSPTNSIIPLSPSILDSSPQERKKSLSDLPSDGSTNNLALGPEFGSSLGVAAFEAISSSSQWSVQTEGATTPLLDWASEPMIPFDEHFEARVSNRSSQSSYESSLGGYRSSLEPVPPPPTEWPVVRIDNLPWSVTADEVEHWLPDGSLASDVCCSPELVENGQVERVTLAVHILCNRVDGRTLNQAFIECSSLEAAKSIVRTRDGTRLKGRPLHVSMSTQSELLSTIFPTYTPGFEGVNANTAEERDTPCPLLLESELAGLLELCRLDSVHASKAPERPYFNLVSIMEKLPFHQVEAYTSQQIVNLFTSCMAAVKILTDRKSRISEWREVLTIFVDAVLRCPAFLASQKRKIVKLAGGLGFVQSVPSKTIDVFYAQPSSSRNSLAAPLAFPPVPSHSPVVSLFTIEPASPTTRRDDLRVTTTSLKSSASSVPGSHDGSASDALLSVLQAPQHHSTFDPSSCSPIPSPTYSFPPSPSPRGVHFPSTTPDSPSSRPLSTRQRRRSSIARRLKIDVDLVAAVAQELGITLA